LPILQTDIDLVYCRVSALSASPGGTREVDSSGVSSGGGGGWHTAPNGASSSTFRNHPRETSDRMKAKPSGTETKPSETETKPSERSKSDKSHRRLGSWAGPVWHSGAAVSQTLGTDALAAVSRADAEQEDNQCIQEKDDEADTIRRLLPTVGDGAHSSGSDAQAKVSMER
jgi:hypothetical protein